MPTEYNIMMNSKARRVNASPELWKYHNIKSRMTLHDSFEYKCQCCHDEEEKWMTEWEAKKHINTKKHESIHLYYRKAVEMENKYIKADKKIKELEKNDKHEPNSFVFRSFERAQKRIKELEEELFECKGVNRVKAFLDECQPTDTIIVEEETEEILSSGTCISNIKRYEVAHSSFDEIYESFCKWSSNSFNNVEFKEQIKKCMIEYQEKMYGLKIGEYERNGTYDEPRFDFKYE